MLVRTAQVAIWWAIEIWGHVKAVLRYTFNSKKIAFPPVPQTWARCQAWKCRGRELEFSDAFLGLPLSCLARSLQDIPFSLKKSKGNISPCKASGLTQNIIKGVVNPGNTVSAHSVAVQKNLGQTTVVGEWRTQGDSSHSSRAQSVAVPQSSVPSGVHG